MKRSSMFAAAILSILSFVHPWTYEVNSVPIRMIASAQSYVLVQIDPNTPLSDGLVGNRCTGGWMRLSSNASVDMVLDAKSRNRTLNRFIFSSSDTAVVIQGNPGALAWCRVDWFEY